MIGCLQTYRKPSTGEKSVRSVNVDSVNRLVEAVRSADGFDMEQILRPASDIGGYAPETDRATNLIPIGKRPAQPGRLAEV